MVEDLLKMNLADVAVAEDVNDLSCLFSVVSDDYSFQLNYEYWVWALFAVNFLFYVSVGIYNQDVLSCELHVTV